MVTDEREIDAYCSPVGDELAIAVSTEATHIRTVEGLSAQTKRNRHRDGSHELFPIGIVVARPSCRIAMTAEEVASAQDEGTFRGICQEQALTAGANHVQSIYVMIAQMCILAQAVATFMHVSDGH